MNGIFTVWKEANSGDAKDGMRIAKQIIIIAENCQLNQDPSGKVNQILLDMALRHQAYRDYTKVLTWIEFFANVGLHGQYRCNTPCRHDRDFWK
jgi:hypothetical protein